MDIKISKIEHKGILLKAYSDLMQVEEALELILKKNDLSKVQFAILGKLDYAYLEEELEKASRQKAVLKKYWDQLLGEGADFGFFSNPEIGTVFIVGPLSTMFLHDVDGKKLGAMSEGPYGILRGMGAGKTNVAKYLNKLNDGSYILLVRGPSYELERLKNSLDAMDKAV